MGPHGDRPLQSAPPFQAHSHDSNTGAGASVERTWKTAPTINHRHGTTCTFDGRISHLPKSYVQGAPHHAPIRTGHRPTGRQGLHR